MRNVAKSFFSAINCECERDQLIDCVRIRWAKSRPKSRVKFDRKLVWLRTSKREWLQGCEWMLVRFSFGPNSLFDPNRKKNFFMCSRAHTSYPWLDDPCVSRLHLSRGCQLKNFHHLPAFFTTSFTHTRYHISSRLIRKGSSAEEFFFSTLLSVPIIVISRSRCLSLPPHAILP